MVKYLFCPPVRQPALDYFAADPDSDARHAKTSAIHAELMHTGHSRDCKNLLTAILAVALFPVNSGGSRLTFQSSGNFLEEYLADFYSNLKEILPRFD